MKIILIIAAVLIMKLSSIASDTTLVLRPVSYSQVFELAKREKKAVLLYFHFDGCGACVKMEKTTFLDKKVADFYNSNFVCLEVNTRKGEGIETNKIYNILLHPSYLFLDENDILVVDAGNQKLYRVKPGISAESIPLTDTLNTPHSITDPPCYRVVFQHASLKPGILKIL